MTRSKTVTKKKKKVPLDHLLLEMRDDILLCLSSPIALSSPVSSLSIWGHRNGSHSFSLFCLFLYSLDWLLCYFYLFIFCFLGNHLLAKTRARNEKGWGAYCLDIAYSYPLPLLVPTRLPFQCLLASISLRTLLLSPLAWEVLLFGTPYKSQRVFPALFWTH